MRESQRRKNFSRMETESTVSDAVRKKKSKTLKAHKMASELVISFGTQ